MHLQNQNKQGFTLIEVIVALAILGLSVGTIFRFQGQLIRGTLNAHNIVDRIPMIKNMFVEALEKNWHESEETHIKKDVDTQTTLTYSLKKAPDNSALRHIEHLKIEKVMAEWPGLLNPQTEILTTARFVLPKAPA